jgi:hypothetical protein
MKWNVFNVCEDEMYNTVHYTTMVQKQTDSY